MPSRTYAVNYVATYDGLDDPGRPIGSDNMISGLLVADDGKYNAYGNFPQIVPVVLGDFRGTFTYDNGIPFGADIDSLVSQLSYTWVTETGGAFPAFRYYISDAVDSQNFIALTQPTNGPLEDKPPVSANWQNQTITFTEWLGGDPITIQEVQSGLHFVCIAQNNAGTPVYFDRINLIVTFTLPAPAPAAPTVVNRYTNRLDMRGVISLVLGGQNSNYPVSYYWEWTDFDPAVKDPPDITYTSASQEILDGNPDARNTTVYTTIPENFSYTDPKAQLVSGKTYWIRLVASNDDNVVESDWTEVDTLTRDLVVI